MSIQIITTEQGVKDLARKMQGVKVIGYDLEFSPLNPHDNSKLFIIAIAFGGTAYVIDYTKVQNVDAIKPYLAGKDVIKIAHNASIDWKHTLYHLGVNMKNVYCTMVAEQVITAGLDVEEYKYTDFDSKERKSMFSLAAVLWRRYRVELDKGVRNIFINYDGSPFDKEVYEYAGKDTLYLERIYTDQQKEIEDKNLKRVINLEMRLLPYVARMEYNGVHFNIDKCIEAIPIVDQIVAKMDKWLQDMFISLGAAKRILITRDGYSCVKLTSWQQVLAAFNAIGIKVDGTDKDILKDWDFKHGIDWNDQYKQDTVWLEDETEDFDIAYACSVLRHYQVIKALQKFKGTYLVGLQERFHKPTGKIYPSFLQTGARATGRFSSRDPNFQNLIKADSLRAIGLGDYDIRGMCYAPPGYKIISLDYEGIELVLLSIISNDDNLIRVILEDDAHKPVTQIIATSFGLQLPDGYKKIKPFSIFRNVAKTLTYAKMYGSGANNLARKLSIPLTQAGYKLTMPIVKTWMDEWNKAFPKAAHALEAAANQAVTQGYVETVLGRRRQWDTTQFTDKSKYFGAMRQGANSVIQGSAADLMKVALVRVAERLDTERAQLIMQVHDEMVILARDDYAVECGNMAADEMIKAGSILWPNAPKGLIKAAPEIAQVYAK